MWQRYTCTQWCFHILLTALQAGHTLEKQHLPSCKHFTNKHSRHWTKKSLCYHHCNIIQRHNILTFDSFVCFADARVVYNVINDLAAPPLKEFIQLHSDKGRASRSTNSTDLLSLVDQPSLLELLTTETQYQVRKDSVTALLALNLRWNHG